MIEWNQYKDFKMNYFIDLFRGGLRYVLSVFYLDVLLKNYVLPKKRSVLPIYQNEDRIGPQIKVEIEVYDHHYGSATYRKRRDVNPITREKKSKVFRRSQSYDNGLHQYFKMDSGYFRHRAISCPEPYAFVYYGYFLYIDHHWIGKGDDFESLLDDLL